MLREKKEVEKEMDKNMPFLKLHLYFTEATEDRLFYFLLHFSN